MSFNNMGHGRYESNAKGIDTSADFSKEGTGWSAYNYCCMRERSDDRSISNYELAKRNVNERNKKKGIIDENATNTDRDESDRNKNKKE